MPHPGKKRTKSDKRKPESQKIRTESLIQHEDQRPLSHVVWEELEFHEELEFPDESNFQQEFEFHEELYNNHLELKEEFYQRELEYQARSQQNELTMQQEMRQDFVEQLEQSLERDLAQQKDSVTGMPGHGKTKKRREASDNW
jgi:hypothetical protein